ncbi:MAG: hypothetical protein EOO53_21470, partial [Gammaproteobacteria bacterium]
MRKLLLLMLGVLLLSTQLLAQSRTVSGRVTDAQGRAIANASVAVKGSNAGTTTSADGSFTLSVPSSSKILVISSIGFAAQEITIGSLNTVSVALSTQE